MAKSSGFVTGPTTALTGMKSDSPVKSAVTHINAGKQTLPGRTAGATGPTEVRACDKGGKDPSKGSYTSDV